MSEFDTVWQHLMEFHNRVFEAALDLTLEGSRVYSTYAGIPANFHVKI